MQHFNGAPFLKAFLVSSTNLDRFLDQQLSRIHNGDFASEKLFILYNWLGRLILFDITQDCLVSLQVAIVRHRAFREMSIVFTLPYLILCLAIFSGNYQFLSLVNLLRLVILIDILLQIFKISRLLLLLQLLLLVLCAILLIGLIQIFVAQRYVSFQLVDLSLRDLG